MGKRRARAVVVCALIVTSMAAGSPAVPAALGATPSASPVAVVSGTTTRVSVSAAGLQGNGNSGFRPVISADGRFVAFESSATNLVPGDTNSKDDIFVYDRTTGGITRASVTDGGAQANNGSFLPAISGDGRYVAFVSSASNLVSGDTNATIDVFVRDLVAGTTVRVSLTAAGGQANKQIIFNGISISRDGRYVAFESTANNLVPDKTGTFSDIYVRDLVAATTQRVSVSSSGTPGNSDSYNPALSGDGRYVTFESWASNLVSNDFNSNSDVFIHDLAAGTTALVSVSTAGSSGNRESEFASASADGRYVAFFSAASNLVAGDVNGQYDVFVRDMLTGTTVLASHSDTGDIGNSNSEQPALSGDGRYVAFWSAATNLVPGDTNAKGDIFVRDLVTGTIARVSVSTVSDQANGASFDPWMNGDGSVVVFDSQATNLVGGDTNGRSDVFARLLQAPNTPPAVSLGSDLATYIGQMITITGHIVDPDAGQTWSGTADYGDGSSAPLTVLGDKSFATTHAYVRLGTYHVTVTIADSAGASGQASMFVTVVHLPLIFVPGVAGSELKATQSGALLVEQEDGSIRNQAYSNGDVLWATLPALTVDEGSFNILRFRDGKPILEPIAQDGNLFAIQLPFGAGNFGYTDVTSFFVSNGYVAGTDYFSYTYDWRFSVETSARGLDDLVGQVLSRTGAPGVDIVAHSQGTLVTRSFLLTGSQASAAAHVVLAGSPQLGTPRGSYVLLAGTCLARAAGLCLVTPKELQFIARTLPGFIDNATSPTYFDLYDGTDPLYPVPYRIVPLQGDPPVAATYAQLRDAELAEQTDLTALDFAELFHSQDRGWVSSVNSRTNARISLFAGTGVCTLGQISQSIKPSLGPTGRPAGFRTVYDYVEVDGDGTVARGSAALGKTKNAELAGSSSVVSTYFRNSEHGQLVSNDFLPDILRILKDEAVAQGEISTPDCPVFSTHSPVEFVLTDSSGRRVGSFDGSTAFQEIPGVAYDRFADMKVAALVPGIYRAELHGTADGEALVQIRFIHGRVAQEFRFAHVPVGPRTIATMTFDAASGTIGQLSVDEDGDGAVDFTRTGALLDATAAADGIPPSVTIVTPSTGQMVVGTAPVSWTTSDAGSGVERSYAWLDRAPGDASTLTAPGGLAFSPGHHVIEVFAEDRAGNIGSTSRTVIALSFTWRPPVDIIGVGPNAGRTLPLQFAVSGASGAAVEDHSVTVALTDLQGAVMAGPLAFTGNPATGVAFVGGSYRADLRTRGIPAGDYLVRVTFNSAGLVGSVVLPVGLR